MTSCPLIGNIKMYLRPMRQVSLPIQIIVECSHKISKLSNFNTIKKDFILSFCTHIIPSAISESPRGISCQNSPLRSYRFYLNFLINSLHFPILRGLSSKYLSSISIPAGYHWQCQHQPGRI